VDKTNISCVAVRYDGNVEYRTSFPRSSFTVNNIYVFNSTSTGNTSAYINALGARKGITTLAPRAGIEGQERTVQWSTVPDGVNAARIALPANYDSRVPTPLVIAAHGHGATAAMFADDSHGKLMANAFLAAGYIVASTVGNATGTEFGSNKLINSQAALYKYVRDHYNIDGVFLYGISMGGLGSLLSAVDERIPDVRAWCGSSPICSLSWAYEQAGWTTEIKTEYGIASDGSDYASKTAGNDPLLKPEAFAGLPMFFVSSPADTVVTKANNADQLAAAVGPYAAEVKTYTAAGQHNDPSQYPASDIVAFFDRFA
jgi:pimeloyl-ACP methyl ester carboxylesterase